MMQKPFIETQQSSNNRYYSSAKNHNKISSSRLFQGVQSTFQQKNITDKEQKILEYLLSENQYKIRTFKESFQMLPDIQTIQFEDGSRYDGQLVDEGIRHGIGIFQTCDGDIYLGDWQQDLYHGYGLYIYHDGQRYQGQLIQGVKEGQGKYFYKDGRVYEGQWSNDQRQGQGIQNDQIKGVYYQGQWSNDLKQGHGAIFLLRNPTHYSQQPIKLFEGIWSKDIFTEGVIYSEIYQGQFLNQTLTGKGVYKFPDGSIYYGQFFNNLFHGHGIYQYANGDIYEGGFSCGLKSGSGVYKYFTGDVYDGEYEKDLKSGEGKFIFINGNYYVGQFQKDSFHGNGKYFFNQNQSITGTWNYGKLIENKTKNEINFQTYQTLTPKTIQKSDLKKSPNKILRNSSPLKFQSSFTQSSILRSKSPFSNKKIPQIYFQKQQKTGIIELNSRHSPSKHNNYSNIQIPNQSSLNNNSFPSYSGQNLNAFSTSKNIKFQMSNHNNSQRQKIELRKFNNSMNSNTQYEYKSETFKLPSSQQRIKKTQQVPKKGKRKLQY